MADKPKKWITASGAHIPVGENGEPLNATGKRVFASTRKNARKKLDHTTEKQGKQAQPEHTDRTATLTEKQISNQNKIRTLLAEHGNNTNKAATAFYNQELHGKTVRRNFGEQTVEIEFKTLSRTDFLEGMNNRDKLWFAPYLPEVIENGEYLGSSLPQHNKHADRFVRMHYVRMAVDPGIPGIGSKNVWVDIGELKHVPGFGFYNMKTGVEHDYPVSERKKLQAVASEKKTADNRCAAIRGDARGQRPLDRLTYSAACDANGIQPKFAIVNIRVEDIPMHHKSNTITFDFAPSMRTFDENGFLHVAASHITKNTVNPYYGREVPGWDEAGLAPDRIYYGLRDADELQKSLPTWSGLPLQLDHHVDLAEDPQTVHRVGSVGTEIRWNAPYVDAPLTVWNQAAIDAIEAGSFRELSCAYMYEPDFTPGEFQGMHYDFIMRNIRGNHVALVEEGRAGSDVVVADSNTTINTEHGGNMRSTKKPFRGAKDAEFVEGPEQENVVMQEPDPQDFLPEPAVEPEPAEPEQPAADEGVAEKLDALIALLSPEQKEQVKAALAGDEDAPEGEEAPEAEAAIPGIILPEPEAVPAMDEDCQKAFDGCELEAFDHGNPEAIKAFIKAFALGKAAGQGEQPAADEEELAPVEPAAEQAEPAADEDEAAEDPAAEPEKPFAAQDSKRIRAQAMDAARAHFRSLCTAAQRVRPLVGTLDAMSFDSADAVYRHVLKQAGVNTANRSADYCRGMVDALLQQRSAKAAPVARDAAPVELTGRFANLNNIIIS